jgi:hypothetical protein
MLICALTPICQAKTLCEEPSEGINKFNLVWLGGSVPREKLQNVSILCKHVIEYCKNNNDNFQINIWTEKHNFDAFSNIKKCLMNDHSGQFVFRVRDVNDLLRKESKDDQSVYNFYIEKQNYAAASDYLRVLAVADQGGCYVDMGYRSLNSKFISEDLQKKDDSKDRFYNLERSFRGTMTEDFRNTGNIKEANTVNSFFSAAKDNEILLLLKQEFSFKNNFFRKYRGLIQGLYDNCSTQYVVLFLIGQEAYNDLYFNVFKNRKDLYTKITTVYLKHLPYRGSNSWLKKNDRCGVFLASMYGHLKPSGSAITLLNTYFEINYSKWIKQRAISQSVSSGSLETNLRLFPSNVAADIFMELLRDYRKNSNHSSYDFGEFNNLSYIESLTHSLQQNEKYSTPNDDKSITRLFKDASGTSDPFSMFSFIIDSSTMKNKFILNTALFVPTPESFLHDQETVVDDPALYFGLAFLNHATNKTIFFPKIRITSYLSNYIINDTSSKTSLTENLSSNDDSCELIKNKYLYTLTPVSNEPISRESPLLFIFQIVEALDIIAYAHIENGWIISFEYPIPKDRRLVQIKGKPYELRPVLKENLLSTLAKMYESGLIKEDGKRPKPNPEKAIRLLQGSCKGD